VSKKHHWVGEADPDTYYGFVYLITNTVSGRKYIGRKFYHTYKKRKRVRESNWRVYAGSCKPLKEDMQRMGKDKFTFEIICNYKTRGGVVSGEVHFQTDNDVLSPELLPCGERLYYNGQIGSVKFITAEFLSAKTRALLSSATKKVRQEKHWSSFKGKTHSSKTKSNISNSTRGIKNHRCGGPYLITFKDGCTEKWDTLGRDGQDIIYDHGALSRLLNGKLIYYKDIVKVERIESDDK